MADGFFSKKQKIISIGLIILQLAFFVVWLRGEVSPNNPVVWLLCGTCVYIAIMVFRH